MSDLTKKDFDEKVFIKLSTLFAKNPEKAIMKSQNYLQKPNFTTYEQYIEDVNRTQSSQSCNASWKESTLCARCLDCCLTDDSTFCMQCYLSGNHDQHRSYLIVSNKSEKCGCGNPYLIKPSGFCQKHPGSKSRPDVDQMSPENRKKFITVFKAAYHGALNSDKEQNCIDSLSWISNFLSIGDGYRRCASIAVTSSGDQFFYTNLIKLTERSTECLLNLFDKLTYDVHFNLQMGLSSIVNYLNLKNSLRKKSFNFHPVYQYLNFCYNFFNERTIRYVVNSGLINWVEFLIQSIDFEFNTLSNHSSALATKRSLYNLLIFIQTILKMDDQHSNILRFIRVYGCYLSKIERSYRFCISEYYENDSDDENKENNQVLFFLMKLNSLFSIQNQNLSAKNKIFEVDDIIAILFDYLKKQDDAVTKTIFSIDSAQSISVDLYLHHLLFCLLSTCSNPEKVVKDKCKDLNINFQEFCVLSTIYPLRVLAAIFCCDYLTIKNPYEHKIFLFLFQKSELLIAPFFGLVQLILKIAPNKDQILRNVVDIFGGFEVYSLRDSLAKLDELPEASKNSFFNSAMFIISILTDRSIISADNYCFKKMLIFELLMTRKASFDQMEYQINEKITNTILEDHLRDYIERVEIDGTSLYKLKDESVLSPFFPIIEYPERIIFLMKYKDNLINIESDSTTLSDKFIEDCVRTPTFLSLTYMCLLSPEKKLIEIQVGLLMFILSVQNGQKFSEESYKSQNKFAINGKDLSEIINNFGKNPQNNNCFTISIKYKRNEFSILQLVQNKEQLGIKAITKAELPQFLLVETTDNSNAVKEKKEKAEKMKASIMNEYKNRLDNFQINEGDKTGIIRQQSSSFLSCCICGNDSTEEDVYVYPCVSIPCILVSFFEEKFHNNSDIENLDSWYSLTICNHPVHMKCFIQNIKNSTNIDYRELGIYTCGIDKGERNCFVPLFQPLKEGDKDDFEIEISLKMKNAINECIKRAFKYEKDISNRHLAETYAGIIATLEIRHRSSPNCLDSPTVPILLRNYLLTLYHYIHPKLKEKKEEKEFNNPTLLLVYSIMEMDKTSEYTQCVQKIAKTLKDDYLFEFLRRAAIIDDFAFKPLDGKPTKFIDWDEVLSFESLIERYELNLKISNSIELPLFDTINLPKNFLDLCKKPYNYDIIDYSVEKCVDLLTGQVVVLNDIDEYCRLTYNDGTAMFLVLTGQRSTAILFYCGIKVSAFIQGSIYLDKFGETDIGFKRGVCLTLSEDKLSMALDQLLSGEIPLKY